MKLANEPTKQLLMEEADLVDKRSSWRDDWNDHCSSTLSCTDESEKFEALFYLGLAKLASGRVRKKRVRFSTVQVREYALTLGDHPQPEAYPVSLDWKHTDDLVVPVDQYRQNSPASPATMHMTRLERRQRLAAIMGLAPIELTIQEEQRQSRERELALLACPFGDDCDEHEEDETTNAPQNACISDSFDSDDFADEIDSCCSDVSDDGSDDSDIVLLADAAPRKRPPITLDPTQISPAKRKGSIVIDWDNTWGNDSLLEDFEEKDYFDAVNASIAAVPIL